MSISPPECHLFLGPPEGFPKRRVENPHLTNEKRGAAFCSGAVLEYMWWKNESECVPWCYI